MRHILTGTSVILVTLAILLTGCAQNGTNGGGGGGGGGGATKYGEQGFVLAFESPNPPPATGSSVFGLGMFQPVDPPAALPDDPFAASLDTCIEYQAGNYTGPNPVNLDIDTLDAGSPITVSGGGASYTLQQTALPGSTSKVYATSFLSPPAGPMPDGLSATIPGSSAYPAFTGKALPDVTAFSLTEPADPTSITTTQTFSWSGSPSSAVVYISGSFGTDNFECYATDDGSFTIPTGAITATGTGNVDMALRIATTSYSSGDAQLVVATGRGQMFQ